MKSVLHRQKNLVPFTRLQDICRQSVDKLIGAGRVSRKARDRSLIEVAIGQPLPIKLVEVSRGQVVGVAPDRERREGFTSHFDVLAEWDSLARPGAFSWRVEFVESSFRAAVAHAVFHVSVEGCPLRSADALRLPFRTAAIFHRHGLSGTGRLSRGRVRNICERVNAVAEKA